MRTWMVVGLLIAGVAEAGPRKPKGGPPPVVEASPVVRAGLPPPPDVAGPPADADRTASGLAWKILSPGPDGPRPTGTSRVTVHYTGWMTNGEMFDSSVERGAPATFGLNQVIEGWTEGLQLLRRGDKARLWIPEDLAYRGQVGAPAGLLVFDVELIDFVTPPPTPLDVDGPPPAALRSMTGLAWRVLTPGTGEVHPKATDTVLVHYTGWLTDGRMIDSSVLRGEPMRLPLNAVVSGWSEGLQAMVVGEKRRLWIPEGLAYKGAPGRPPGMLVFDVELLEIEPELTAPTP
jgi:FKBP-type peptidyl-prolyl cis-trans isomerase